MTKRDFDAETKHNYGMPRGDRTAYRESRHRYDSRAPLLERRAAYLARRGISPLDIRSPLRAPALYAAGLWPRRVEG